MYSSSNGSVVMLKNCYRIKCAESISLYLRYCILIGLSFVREDSNNREMVNEAIKSYFEDSKYNIARLFQYLKQLRLFGKAEKWNGMWLDRETLMLFF